MKTRNITYQTLQMWSILNYLPLPIWIRIHNQLGLGFQRTPGNISSRHSWFLSNFPPYKTNYPSESQPYILKKNKKTVSILCSKIIDSIAIPNFFDTCHHHTTLWDERKRSANWWFFDGVSERSWFGSLEINCVIIWLLLMISLGYYWWYHLVIVDVVSWLLLMISLNYCWCYPFGYCWCYPFGYCWCYSLVIVDVITWLLLMLSLDYCWCYHLVIFFTLPLGYCWCYHLIIIDVISLNYFW